MDIQRKLSIPYPIIVEGKYDRLRLLTVCNAHIITTDGFALFKKSEKLALFRELCKKTPIIVLTDSDGAGGVIRAHISSAVPRDRIIQLHIPKIAGRESRKAKPSAEGTLGVEGMTAELLYDMLAPFEDESALLRLTASEITKTDLYVDGLTGGEDSKAKRDALCQKLGLPTQMTSNALLAALRILLTREEYLSAVERDAKS